MSSLLYRLAKAVVRRRGRVLAGWLIVLVLAGAGAGLLGQGTEDDFEIPGAQSQEALNHLEHVFPQVSGAQAQIAVSVPEGQQIDTPEHRKELDALVERLGELDQVEAAVNPFGNDGEGLSEDGRAAMVMVQMTTELSQVTDQTRDQLTGITEDLRADLGPGSEAHAGGDIFSVQVPEFGLVEVMGVVIAFLVLLLMFRSLITATMPLVTAIIGVGIAMGITFLSTAFITLSSAAPLLAVMLGLAVGIDYALFIISRHRDQLAEGVEVDESIARAVATAGSAVLFAGLTVIIALLALAVPGMPFLTTMGQFAAVAVMLAVLVALTLIPALLGYVGARLRPRQKTNPRRRATQRTPLSLHWVRAITKAPLLTVLIVVAGLGLCTLPAQNLQLALPGANTQDPGTPARETYDLIAERFGPGYNSPMVVTADIIGSKDPLGVVNGIADEIREMPGVAAVPMATPNPTIDTGIIQIYPETAADSPRTQELVEQLRAKNEHFKDKYGSETAVTGMTAVQIDLSKKLGDALLPFGIIVVGLSLVLLTMLFRSIWVPVKAAVGYLLSVGTAFGITALVFNEGHFAGLLGVTHVGSVLSFLPILLMGILFGLAMDYEVFLVSRIREEYTRHGDARKAVEQGFASASRVVIAAAIIMLAVFAAFVPSGDAQIKPIAFALAVGIFVDAFIVRMTLVPAVLVMLGDRAWRLPRWLDRKLPSFDVEGEGLLREIELAEWPGAGVDEVISAANLRVDDHRGHPIVTNVDIRLPRGGVLCVHSDGEAGKTALLYALGGRVKVVSGNIKVLDRVLPQHQRAVRGRVAIVACRDTANPAAEIEAALGDGVELILIDDLDSATNRQREAVCRSVESAGASSRATFVLTCQSSALRSGSVPANTSTQLFLPAVSESRESAWPVEV